MRRRIREETGAEHTGPIYLLANLRYFGYVMNPIACYYCFNDDETRLEYVVAEVNNTPWNERHSYVLAGPASGRLAGHHFRQAVPCLAVQPHGDALSLAQQYAGERLVLHMENSADGEKVFDATLSLSARPMTAASLNKLLFRYPFMTAKVGLAIYWQALRCF